MNNKGQFLLYDALLALILVTILFSTIILITGYTPEYVDYTSTSQALNTLSDTNYSQENILKSWSNGNNETITTINQVLQDEYQLKDLTNNKTLTKKKSNKNKTITSQKIIEGHKYELTYYY